LIRIIRFSLSSKLTVHWLSFV